MKKIILIGILAVMLGTGCKKDFLTSLQNNPNAPTSSAASVQLVLPGTLTGIVSIINNVGYSGGYEGQAAWMGYWNYAGGYSFNNAVQSYVLTNTSPQVWDQYYAVLSNLNVIHQNATADPSLVNYEAISDVLESICFQNLVDVYNDIPYTDALKGQGDFFPAYDKGSDVYDSLVAKLDLAISLIQTNLSSSSVVVPAQDDIMFGGNMQMWLTFANTVKLRMLVRESNVSAKQAYIKSELSATASAGYLGLHQDALVNPGYSSSKPSPMYGAFGIAPNGSINGSFNYNRGGNLAMDFYKTTNDPRLAYFYGKNGTQPNDPNGDYYNITFPLNYSNYSADYLGIQTTPTANGSGIGPGLIQNASQSAVMMTASESLFNQAEAVVRGYITGNAEDLYHQAITASFEYLNVGGDPDTYAQAYYNQTGVKNVSWPSDMTGQIQAILTQKWAALNGISNVEAWNDWRRTGYPVIKKSLSPTSTESHPPYRYYYPVEEPNYNPVAWKNAGGATIDPFTSKIFWMP
jgi:hypothetical protein